MTSDSGPWWAAAGVFVLPFLVYFSVKFGTLGYLRARELFDGKSNKGE